MNQGISSENRNGEKILFPLISLSIGATCTVNRKMASCHEIATVTSELKRQAKKQAGSFLCIDRRRDDHEGPS